MKEALACNKCEGIICADTQEGERVIGQKGTDRFVTFPENVKDCCRRVEVPEVEWHIPVGRPDLMMPVHEPRTT